MVYKLGAQLVAKGDRNVIATVVERRIMAGVPHYRLLITPNLYNAPPRWLSEYGILVDFEPAGSIRRKSSWIGSLLSRSST